MSKPQRLGEIIFELMTLFTKRREIEARIMEGTASEKDLAKLEVINQTLQE